MKGTKNRPNLKGTVPYDLTNKFIQDHFQNLEKADRELYNRLISLNSSKDISRKDASDAQEAYVKYFDGIVSRLDANYIINHQGKVKLENDFRARYRKSGGALSNSCQKRKPNMTESFRRGTQPYRRVRAEIAHALGIRDAGHNVGHRSTSTVRDNRGQIIENLLSRVTAPEERRRVIAASRRVYGYIPTRS